MKAAWFFVAACSFAALGTPAAHAQELWRGISAGMSLADVQAAFPDAEAAKGSPLGGGLEPRLVLTPRDISGIAFRPTIYFNGSEAALVQLRPSPGADPIVFAPGFGRIRSALIDTYGEPAECSQTPVIPRNVRCRWHAPNAATEVSLSWYDTGGPNDLLSVTYRLVPDAGL